MLELLNQKPFDLSPLIGRALLLNAFRHGTMEASTISLGVCASLAIALIQRLATASCKALERWTAKFWR